MDLLDQAHWSLMAALQERGKISAAAAVLGITQSAATQRLREAERRLGVRLTQKQGRGLVLTDAGATLAAAAQSTQPTLRQAESEAVWQGKRSTHRLRLCQSQFDPPSLAVHLINACKGADPALSVEVTQVAGDDIGATIFEGAADIALLPGRPDQVWGGARLACRDRLVAIFSPETAPSLGVPVTPSAFADLPYLTFGLRPEKGWEYDLFFERGQAFPSEAVRIESTELICRLVAEGAGASILPKLCVDHSASQEGLQICELDCEPIHFDWHLIHSPDVANPILDHLQAAFVERQQTWPTPTTKLAGGPRRREGVARP